MPPCVSWRDPVTNVLQGFGYVDPASAPVGSLTQTEVEDFALVPGLWQWNGAAWVAFTPPAPKPTAAQADLIAALATLAADATAPASVKALGVVLKAYFNL